MTKFSRYRSEFARKHPFVVICIIVFIVVGFYFVNFQLLRNENWWNVFQNLSEDTGKWGEFGDYVGGILNPVIAAFAFYYIAKTYELQKSESAKTIKIAALTALLNSNLTRIGLLESEKTQWLQSQERLLSKKDTHESYETYLSDVGKKIWEIQSEIDELQEKNKGFEREIESLFEGQK